MANKSKVKPLVAQYAISLRKEGKSYSEIVELCSQIDKTNSITLNWCKRNLSDIEKVEDFDSYQIEKNCLDQIITIGASDKGISSAECKRIIKYNYKLEDIDSAEVYKLYKKLKAKALAMNSNVFFRPSCLQPDQATRSFKQILSSGNYLYDVIADVVNDICTEFPEVYSSSVRRELASIIFPELKLMGGGAIRCKHLEEAVETLKERVPQIPYNEDAQYYKPSFHIDESELPY